MLWYLNGAGSTDSMVSMATGLTFDFEVFFERREFALCEDASLKRERLLLFSITCVELARIGLFGLWCGKFGVLDNDPLLTFRRDTELWDFSGSVMLGG